MKQSNIEAIIFDWAGTTVDFGCFAPVQAFIEAFKEFDIQPTVEEVRKPMGMLKRDHIKTMMTMDRIHQLWKQKNKRDWTEQDIEKVYALSEKKLLEILHQFAQPKPYVLETVQVLRDKGLKIGSTTGYTDKMMDIVVPKAKELGYRPDCWYSPNSVQNMGRPYPYMIFRNLETLKVSKVQNVIKVGDTKADISEGKNAGVISVGITDGSSEMALTQHAFEQLSENDKSINRDQVKKVYLAAGADHVIHDIRGLLDLI